jgi:hypothetical protein
MKENNYVKIEGVFLNNILPKYGIDPFHSALTGRKAMLIEVSIYNKYRNPKTND